MGKRVRRMTCREVERILAHNGFQFVSQHGSHRKWRHPHKRLQVIVPEHRSKDLPIGTLVQIFENAQITADQWKDGVPD